MEVCRMDASHYYSGTDNNNESQQMPNVESSEMKTLSDYNTAASTSSYFETDQTNYQTTSDNTYRRGGYSSFGNEDHWKGEDIECKRETDGAEMQIDESANYSVENFNKPYQYGYSSVSPVYTNFNTNSTTQNAANNILHKNNIQQNHLGPYHMSSTKNQLPSWYTPPSPSPYFPTQPGCFPHQHPPSTYPPIYMPSTSAAVPPDHNMRNMIQLANSGDYDNSKAVNKLLNGREARNRAEKHRRDKLNGSIQELSSMVPHVAESPRRVDKTAVLRFSAHGLRIDYVFGQQKSNRYLVNPKSTEGLMKLLDTFLLTVTCRGNIVLVSDSVEQYLGHCRSDLYGQNLLNITHPDDHAFLKQQLIPTDLHNLFAAKTDENGEIRSRTTDEELEIDKKLREDRRDFTIRLSRAGPRSEPTTYEMVRIDGCFRRADAAPRGKPNTGPTGLQLIRRARGRDDSIPLHSISGNDIILIAMARVIKPPMFCDRLIEACRYEYKTRNLIDGRIVQCDQRISIVAGYMTEEIAGLSPFTFIHKDDVRWVMVALRQMYDFGKPFGESCYRLMSRTGKFIYLKTRGALEVDDKTRQVHSFVCVNTLVPDDEGRRLVREMKKKFSAIISESELSAMESDVPAVENPQLLERAILNLITNLNNTQSYEDDNMSMISDSTVEDDTKRKTPPLAIIAPKTNTIKSSIFKAVEVMGHSSAGKGYNIKDEPKSPETVPIVQMPQIVSCDNDSSSPRQQSSGIKIEPTVNILSPTSSSMSSIDSDACSPFLSTHATAAMASTSNDGIYTTTTTRHYALSSLPNSSSKNEEFFSPYDNLPLYDIETVSTKSSTNTFSSSYACTTITSAMSDSVSTAASSIIVNNNNNKSNINRNSVLKRAYKNEGAADNEYTELIKRRALSVNSDLNSVIQASPNPPLELLSTSVSDFDQMLSSPFNDDDNNLSENLHFTLSPELQIQDLTSEEEEKREILKSLRESSVIQTNPSGLIQPQNKNRQS